MKRINLILLLDSSKSISGKKIGALTDASHNIIQMFQAMDTSDDRFEGYIGAIIFGKETSFYPLKPAKLFSLDELEFGGDTKIGEMLQKLSEELSSNVVFSSRGENKNILVLISDGGATDVLSEGYVDILRNDAFIYSRRIAVSIGSRANKNILSSFCTISTDIFSASDIESVKDVFIYTVDRLVAPKPDLQYERQVSTSSDWD